MSQPFIQKIDQPLITITPSNVPVFLFFLFSLLMYIHTHIFPHIVVANVFLWRIRCTQLDHLFCKQSVENDRKSNGNKFYLLPHVPIQWKCLTFLFGLKCEFNFLLNIEQYIIISIEHTQILHRSTSIPTCKVVKPFSSLLTARMETKE